MPEPKAFIQHVCSRGLTFSSLFIRLDDITMTADGVDCYQIVKDANRYK